MQIKDIYTAFVQVFFNRHENSFNQSIYLIILIDQFNQVNNFNGH